jgi:hypothetical protein
MSVVLLIMSIAAAVVCATIAWHASHEEQRRSDARVAALAAAVDGAGEDAVGGAGAPSPGHAMFERPEFVAVSRNPTLVAVAGITVTVAVLGGLILATRGAAETSPNPGGTAASTQPASAQPQLELLAMRDARHRDTLTISGLVRNGRGAEADHLTAVILAFGRDGHFLATGWAPLEITRLRPGEESPFVVSVAGVRDAQRYRVTFRNEQGVVRHVDMRPGA